MAAILIAICAVALLIGFWWAKRTKNKRQLEQYSITPEALQELLKSRQDVLVYDVRLPLDFLTDSETIPGAKRLAPKEVIENPALIPRDKDAIVYCTCPSDETSRSILQRALALRFVRIKFLKGGLEGWKAKGYPVEPYTKPFHLDSAT